MSADAVIRYDEWSGGWSLTVLADARMTVALAQPKSWTPGVDEIVRQHLTALGFDVVSTSIDDEGLSIDLAPTRA